MKINRKLFLITSLAILLAGSLTVQALEPIGDPPPTNQYTFTADVYSELEAADGSRIPFPTTWSARLHVNATRPSQHEGTYANLNVSGTNTTAVSASSTITTTYATYGTTDFHLDSVSAPYGYRFKRLELKGVDYLCVDSFPNTASSTINPPNVTTIDWPCSAEISIVYEQIPGVTFEVVSTDPGISYTITPIGTSTAPQSTSTAATPNLHHFPTQTGSYTFRMTVNSESGYIHRAFNSTIARPLNPSAVSTTISLPVGSKEVFYITRERPSMTQTLEATNLNSGQTVEATTGPGSCLMDCPNDPSIVTLPSSPGDQIHLVWSTTYANSCVGSWTEPPYGVDIGRSGSTTVSIPGGGEGLTGGGGSSTTTDLVSFILRCTQNPIKAGRQPLGR